MTSSSRDVLVAVTAVSKRFTPTLHLLPLGSQRASTITALHGVSLEILRGEIFGVAGESGSGKTTLAEIIVGLDIPTSGRVLVDGRDVGALDRRGLKAFRRQVQIVFQNPYDAHNPRFTVRQTVEEPLKIHDMKGAAQRSAQVDKVLEQVRLRPPSQYLDKRVHQLSGGERQRLSIARALTLSPKLLIADEPTSMLDVSVRTGILNLFKELNRSEELTVMIISHDLCSLVQVCDRIAVMRHGVVVELGPAETIVEAPLHSYTRALLAAVPDFDPVRLNDPAWVMAGSTVEIDESRYAEGLEEEGELVEVGERHFVRTESVSI